MDIAAIFTIINKGLTLIPYLISAGVEVGSVISDLQTLSAAGAAGTVTDQQLTDLEAKFDAALADFNKPLS